MVEFKIARNNITSIRKVKTMIGNIKRVTYEIPFYSQLVNYKGIKGLQGFKNKEEAKYWEKRGCGIASLKMIIDGFQKYRNKEIVPSYGELLYKGLEIGAHCDRGWIHKGLVD